MPSRWPGSGGRVLQAWSWEGQSQQMPVSFQHWWSNVATWLNLFLEPNCLESSSSHLAMLGELLCLQAFRFSLWKAQWQQCLSQGPFWVTWDHSQEPLGISATQGLLFSGLLFRVLWWDAQSRLSLVKAVPDAFWRVILAWEKHLLFKMLFFLKGMYSSVVLRVVICHETQPKLPVKSPLFCLQGTRVWLRENGQHFPSTVNSCAEGVVVFRTDYGQVSTRGRLPDMFCFRRLSCKSTWVFAAPLSPSPPYRQCFFPSGKNQILERM